MNIQSVECSIYIKLSVAQPSSPGPRQVSNSTSPGPGNASSTSPGSPRMDCQAARLGQPVQFTGTNMVFSPLAQFLSSLFYTIFYKNIHPVIIFFKWTDKYYTWK
jgi:hypothetical protein